ncbi:MAG: hypothetical protein ACTHOU_08205 [Aureliella sp.]
MAKKREAVSPLSLGERITCLPVVHGSGHCALIVRKWLLENEYDCVAVCLPQSFRSQVLDGIKNLPTPSLVLQRCLPDYGAMWQPSGSPEEEDERDSDAAWSYVPIDPCQPVIMALRLALGEHLPIEFIDLETNVYQPDAVSMPDPYALKTVSLERFATAVLPSIVRPFSQQCRQRLAYMGWRLRKLEKRYRRIAVVCSIQEWPWLRESYLEPPSELPEHDAVEPPATYAVSPNSLMFLFGELPFITGLYERARRALEDDENLSIDGVKQLLMSARSSYLQDLGKRARRITPLLLRQCLKYIRNLTLMDRRLTPDLFTIATAAQQILGDQYAIHLIETARNYPFEEDLGYQEVTLGIDQARLPGDEVVSVVSRLPGPPLLWRSLKLQRRPARQELDRWKTQWNPYSQCSWPPEDKLIESFRTRVIDRARAIIGADLARSEKFTSSIKDGIDIRETIRHWYDGDLYVKVMPPSVGAIDCCVMLFDVPADPQNYPWRTTWFAEHAEESTLAFYATDFHQQMVGPGIAQATYGGAMFLYPPLSIVDIWEDPRLEFAQSLEERLVAAACLHARERQIALLSPQPPSAVLRQIARRFRRTLVHIPLSQFNDALVQQLRMVHVLNGRQVRSFAAHFIRKA